MLQRDCPEDGPAQGRGRGVSLWCICKDADALHAEFSARGVKLKAPKVAFYGMRQFEVPDPDGYHIWFESRAAKTPDV